MDYARIDVVVVHVKTVMHVRMYVLITFQVNVIDSANPHMFAMDVLRYPHAAMKHTIITLLMLIIPIKIPL